MLRANGSAKLREQLPDLGILILSRSQDPLVLDRATAEAVGSTSPACGRLSFTSSRPARQRATTTTSRSRPGFRASLSQRHGGMPGIGSSAADDPISTLSPYPDLRGWATVRGAKFQRQASGTQVITLGPGKDKGGRGSNWIQ